jgi:ParB family chromosome partitioning protein
MRGGRSIPFAALPENDMMRDGQLTLGGWPYPFLQSPRSGMQEQTIVYLNPRGLLPSKRNVRSDPGDLAGLAETIREHGILQPLGVVREKDVYRVVYGHRRRDAAIVVGLDRVPCLLLNEMAEDDAVLQQVLENLQRLDLNDMDKARAFESMLAHLVDQGRGQGEAQEVMARTLGLSARQIQRYLRLRQLAPAVQEMIVQGDLGVTQAQHLVDLTPFSRQDEVAQLAVEESLSAAELARWVAALQRNANIEARAALMALRRGERVAVVERQSKEVLQRLNQGAPPSEEGAVQGGEEGDKDEQIVDQFPTCGERAPDGAYADGGPDYGALEPVTRDGNRVLRIHSLDSFADEVQRLVSCVQDGDLQRLLERDPQGNLKARLVARQLRFLADAVGALAGVATDRAADAAWGDPTGAQQPGGAA